MAERIRTARSFGRRIKRNSKARLYKSKNSKASAQDVQIQQHKVKIVKIRKLILEHLRDILAEGGIRNDFVDTSYWKELVFTGENETLFKDGWELLRPGLEEIVRKYNDGEVLDVLRITGLIEKAVKDPVGPDGNKGSDKNEKADGRTEGQRENQESAGREDEREDQSVGMVKGRPFGSPLARGMKPRALA